MELKNLLLCVLFMNASVFLSQNLITDTGMNAAANWGNQELNAETIYLTGTACAGNNVMEVDAASFPQQSVAGFLSGYTYVLTFRYAWRTQGCSASSNPTSLNIQFTDAPAILNSTVSVSNTVTSLTSASIVFTNGITTSHTLKFTNPGNTNTCGVIIDDVSITMLASPGGVGTAFVSSWFRAGSISITDGAGIYGWISNGNNNIILKPSCLNPPLYKTGLASTANSFVANYNPYITFNGTNQYLANTVTRFDLMNLGVGGSVFAVHQGGTGASTYYAQKSSTSAWGGIWLNTGGVQMANGVGTGRNAAYTASTRNNILAFNGIATFMNLKDKNGVTLSDNSGTSDVDYLTVGARQTGAGTVDQYFNGSISEAIEFNVILTDLPMQQVRSYLATKYGVTLYDNTQTLLVDEGSYVASDGLTLYWTYLFNFLYHNNVTIIGRDDATGLDQRKSVSTDADVNGVTTGSNAMLTIDNGGAFTADKSFFATGHNGISNSGTMETSDIPFGIQSRMKRFWKFQKTGLGVANSITAKFDMTGFTPLTGSDLRLLVSTLPSFTTLTTSVITGAYSAPYFTVSLPTTGGIYYTLASAITTFRIRFIMV